MDVGDEALTDMGMRMLADLGVLQLCVIFTPRKLVALAGLGLEVIDDA